MSKRPTISSVTSGYRSTTQINTSLEALRDQFDNTLSLDGSTPNSMSADLDMNSNDIINVKDIETDTLRLAGQLVSTTLYALEEGTSRAYSNRAALVSASAINPPTGTIAFDGKVFYQYDGVTTDIPDLQGWKAAGQWVQPYHFGAVGDGVTDDKVALGRADDHAVTTGRGVWLEGTFGIASGQQFEALKVDGPGKIALLSGFSGTTGILLGDAVDGEYPQEVNLHVDASAIQGRMRGGWSAASGSFPSGSVLAGDEYIVNTAGTVDGQAFAVYNVLRALVNAPSTSTYAANWTIRQKIDAVKIDSAASPFTNYRIFGTRCDDVLRVKNSTERSRIEVAGRYCYRVLRVEEDTGTPDNNTIIVRGSSCYQWAYITGNAVTQLIMDTQITWDVSADAAVRTAVDLPGIHIDSDRTTMISGIMRGDQWTSVYVETGTSDSTHIVFDDLHIEAPSYDTNIIPSVVDIVKAQWVSGTINIDNFDSTNGVWLKDVGGGNLTVNVEDPNCTTVVRLGMTSGSKICSNLRLSLLNRDGISSATYSVISELANNCLVEVIGDPHRVTHTAGSRTSYKLPAKTVEDNINVTLTTIADVEFQGLIPRAEFRAYSYAAPGMHGWTDDGLETMIVYTGTGATDGWQRPTFQDV